MKNILTIIVFLFSASLLKAQDATLPKGNSTIYLHSGKTIRNITLWRIDSTKVEYVLSGNLADLTTMDVSKIETPEFLIEFDQQYQMKKKGYDIIVLLTKDTLRGFIQGIYDDVISYRPVGSDKVKRAMKYEVKSYVQWREQGSGSPTDTVAQRDVTKVLYEAPSTDESIVDNPDSIDEEAGTLQKIASEGTLKNEIRNDFDYHQSYDRGVSDAFMVYKEDNWDSPFLSVTAVNSKVKKVKIPFGMDEKSYRDGYESEIVKRKAKRASATGTLAKAILLLIIISAF